MEKKRNEVMLSNQDWQFEDPEYDYEIIDYRGEEEKAEDEKEYRSRLQPLIFKTRLNIALQYSGKSREKIKEETLVTSSMLSNYLGPLNIVPSFKTFQELVRCLEVNRNWLLGDPDADIEGAERPLRLTMNKLIRRREHKLAQMLAIHLHMPADTVEVYRRLIRSFVGLNKTQLNQVLITSKGIGRSESLNSRSAQLITYTSYSSENKEDVLKDYSDLISLNQITESFSPIQLIENTNEAISDEDIMDLVKKLNKLRNDPVYRYEFDLMLDSIEHRIQSREESRRFMIDSRNRRLEREKKALEKK